ncbi:high-affinity iron transporter [Candidatus Peregrinibacteria bacterium CG10_big_fil_rev_8_21_14_0_10_49_24]|nr:MAG: high-affinity iron transporter [Candidatus Peregrinibacteria bacterium CG11_big_fil_rev_8_21_14_0_20_49_14]PIR51380.1 MAG: high-affinity iron transporter [Candidatus Peregrinibacteria bacterium CG10_big_fil_rev_8_21_14_0_10_49_24]PJA68144.1 MAG: high-affinity iron transporter [Candidatus Peregrinibacteria bacterium CG_4_9_14_3_um_filter_49_12]
MTAASLITLRETLEASLIVGIVLAYLQCTHNQRYNITIWFGVLAGVVVSLILAIFFQLAFGGFEGRAEALYEGFAMLLGAGLMTWMILWMLRQRRTIRKDVEQQVEFHLENDHPWGLFSLVFFSTAREGIETVIFLQAALVHSGGVWQMFGGLLGIAVAIIISFFLFKGIVLVSLRQFFSVTSLLLILFAAGLIAHGIHELQEAALLPVLIDNVWDINPVVLSEGVYPLLHEKGAIGGIVKSLFGYNGNPSFLEIMGYLLYLLGITLVWRRIGDTPAAVQI